MKDYRHMMATAILSVAAFLLLVPAAWGRSHPSPYFEYAAGTANLPKGCEGKLAIMQKVLVYRCDDVSLAVPYDSITHMEYRRRVSKEIRKMKLPWAIRPTSSRGKNKGFFTIIFSDKGKTRAIVLKVTDDTMRPYMAEIDLKTGRSIDSNQD